MLKLRWQMLKSFPARLGTPKIDHLISWEVIKAAMVLHNLYIATAEPWVPTAEETAEIERDHEEQELLAAVEQSTRPHEASRERYGRREQIAWLTALADKKIKASTLRSWFPNAPEAGSDDE
jgi:hypothetical protein